MYVARVPMYVYPLPCGPDHRLRSYTASEPDDEDGLHWFFCRRCPRYVGIKPADLTEHRPKMRGETGRPWGDGALGKQMDNAILRDRVLPVLRRTWGALTVATVAAQHDVPERLVRSVAEDLGIYRSALRD